MKTTASPAVLHTTLLAACLVLATACSRQADPATAPASGHEPTTALGGVVKKATDEARKKLATENLDVGGGKDNGNLPRAQISPQGDLLIGGKPVAINDKQRALLLAHRANIIAIAEAGIAIGVKGADLGVKAASEALAGLFTGGNGEDFDKRMEAEGKKMEAEAMKLCERMPAMLASQQALAAAIPEFKPYATMDQSDVDDCNSGNHNFDTGKDTGQAVARAIKEARDDAASQADAAAAQADSK